MTLIESFILGVVISEIIRIMAHDRASCSCPLGCECKRGNPPRAEKTKTIPPIKRAG